jgi:hypothetical protein
MTRHTEKDARIARHTKGNKSGSKAERPNIRVINKGRFIRFEAVGSCPDGYAPGKLTLVYTQTRILTVYTTWRI